MKTGDNLFINKRLCRAGSPQTKPRERNSERKRKQHSNAILKTCVYTGLTNIFRNLKLIRGKIPIDTDTLILGLSKPS